MSLRDVLPPPLPTPRETPDPMSSGCFMAKPVKSQRHCRRESSIRNVQNDPIQNHPNLIFNLHHKDGMRVTIHRCRISLQRRASASLTAVLKGDSHRHPDHHWSGHEEPLRVGLYPRHTAGVSVFAQAPTRITSLRLFLRALLLCPSTVLKSNLPSSGLIVSTQLATAPYSGVSP